MPTLNWIGKDAVVNHHKEVPFRLLKCHADLSVGDPDSGNLLVQGDNLEALKALLPYYAGQVKCIYIDPPYNTGKEDWVYNDNVNSVEMRNWLGEIVGKEGDDLSRHDKWLCMMYPRLRLLYEFLSEDGVIFISINDIENASLRMICDEIFGKSNFLAQLIWNSEGNTDNQLEIKVNHEYILLYTKNSELKDQAIGKVIDPNTREDSNLWKGIADNNINKNNPANPPDIVELPVGFPCSEKTLFYAKKEVDEKFFEITAKDGFISDETKKKYKIENLSGLPVKLDDMVVENYKLTKPCRIYGGFANRNKLTSFIQNGLRPIDDDGAPLRFYVNRNAAVRYHRENNEPRNILSVLRNFGTTEKTKTKLKKIGIQFNYPKPVELIQYLLSIGAQSENSIVLDSFSGSGTTAHALLNQNAEDGLNRKFILVEMDRNIATNVTVERLKKVITEYKDNESSNSGFRYCELGTPLFDPNRQIQEEVKYNDLAQHVYFVETGQPLPQNAKKHFPLLGVSNSTAVYLLYNGILKDKSVNGGNVLTYDVLESLPAHDGQKVIYGNGSRISKARLNDLGIVFKQIPYEIREM